MGSADTAFSRDRRAPAASRHLSGGGEVQPQARSEPCAR